MGVRGQVASLARDGCAELRNLTGTERVVPKRSGPGWGHQRRQVRGELAQLRHVPHRTLVRRQRHRCIGFERQGYLAIALDGPIPGGGF